MLACQWNHTETALALADLGADIEAKDKVMLKHFEDNTHRVRAPFGQSEAGVRV